MRRECLYCRRLLVWVSERGWVHVNGGGAYWQRCGECGWEGSGVGIRSCPECGGTRHLKDDHCGLPDMEKEPIAVPDVTAAQASDEALMAQDPGPQGPIRPHPFHGGELLIGHCVQCGEVLNHELHRRDPKRPWVAV